MDLKKRIFLGIRFLAGCAILIAGQRVSGQVTSVGPAQAQVQKLEVERLALDAQILVARQAAEREAEARKTVAAFEAMRPAADAAKASLGISPDVTVTPEEKQVSSESAANLIAAVDAAKDENGRQKFGGIEFGVGISLTTDIGTNDRVTDAEVVDGIVRVKDSDNSRARIMLESHYFFKNHKTALGLPAGDIGFGPFMALQPGTDNLVDAVAIGGMIGFRKGQGSESFNLGLGVVVDPNTRILGDGIVANRPLPGGETEIRFKEQPQTGILLIASFGF